MKKILVLSLATLFLNSCNKEVKNDYVSNTNDTVSENTSSSFKMYDMTEGALLMEEMYAYNTQLKEQILAGDSLASMPKNLAKLPYVSLTDPTDKDDFYIKQAGEFLQFQQAIYTAEDKKAAFNTMVESCLTCHAKKCGGPIPRIKKLFIK